MERSQIETLATQFIKGKIDRHIRRATPGSLCPPIGIDHSGRRHRHQPWRYVGKRAKRTSSQSGFGGDALLVQRT